MEKWKIEKEPANRRIQEKKKTSAYAIAVLAALILAEKTQESDKPTTNLMKKFGKDNKKTNSDNISCAVKTVWEKTKAEVDEKNAVFLKLV